MELLAVGETQELTSYTDPVDALNHHQLFTIAQYQTPGFLESRQHHIVLEVSKQAKSIS